MNTYTTESFQKYERKRPSKRLLDTYSEHTSPDEHSERYNKGNCVKKGWRMVRDSKRNWREEV